MVTELRSDHVGSASSILNAGAQVGGFFAPVLTPMIGGRFGWSWSLYAGAVTVCAGAAAIYFMKIRTENLP
jgi:MFS family permease